MNLFYKIKELYDTVLTKANISKPMLVGLKEKGIRMTNNTIDIELGNAFIRSGITGVQTFTVINASAVEDDAVISFFLSVATTGDSVYAKIQANDGNTIVLKYPTSGNIIGVFDKWSISDFTQHTFNVPTVPALTCVTGSNTANFITPVSTYNNNTVTSPQNLKTNLG